MIDALVRLIARACIAVAGLPAVALECRRAEAAKAARGNVVLAIGFRDDDGNVSGDAIEARGLGFGEYMMPTCDCAEEGEGDD